MISLIERTQGCSELYSVCLEKITRQGLHCKLQRIIEVYKAAVCWTQLEKKARPDKQENQGVEDGREEDE